MELLIAAVVMFLLAVIVGFLGCRIFRCCRPVAKKEVAHALPRVPAAERPTDEIDERIFQAMCTPPMWFLAIAFSVSIGLAQDVAPVSPDVNETAGYVPIEKRVRPDRDRKHRHDEPMPQPDQQPGEGESVVIDPDFGELVVEPVESHADREARKKAHAEALRLKHEEQERHRAELEKQRREQEEYDLAHPKPAAPTGLFGFVWSWVIGPSLWAICAPFMWIITLIKWGGIIVLLIILALLATAIVFFGSAAVAACRWCWRKTCAIWSRT